MRPVKILFVANRIPFPPFRGDKLKIWNLANRLKAGNEIHLITIAETREDLNYRQHLEEVFSSVTILFMPKWKSALNTALGMLGSKPLQVAYFKSPAFAGLLKDKIQQGNYDAIHVQHLRMAQYFEPEPASNVILDLPDAFSLYWKRRSQNAKSWWMRLFAKLEYKRLLRYERSVLPRFNLNLVCSDEDALYLREHSKARIEVLPNGVDTAVFHPKSGISRVKGRILFTGNMDYEPNVDAVVWFCEEILPRILKENPDAEFVIAGQRPVSRVMKLANKHVRITGFVQDISAEYAKADVVVAPLRFGAGTQNKVLEAMAMGIPVVCTAIGFKGLGIESGQGAVLAQNADEFAMQVTGILQNEEYRAKLVAGGGDIIRTRFSWDAIAVQLENFLRSVCLK